MKRLISMALALAMAFALAVSTGAAETIADNTSRHYDTTDDGYDDYLVESLARGSSIPSASKLWSFSNGQYKGNLHKIRTGVYTNYCFYPNNNGRLTFSYNVQREIDANYEYHNYKVCVSIYDMSGKFVLETQTSELYTNSLYNPGSFTFSGLDTNTKYCFFIFVYNEVCQISGDIWVSN